MLTQNEAANQIIVRFDEKKGDTISNKKLQKLLYYAQGWNLATEGEPLFQGDVEAWEHGPVIAGQYDRFEGCYIISTPEEVTRKESALLDALFEIYGRIDANILEEMTHEERPWKETYSHENRVKIPSEVIKDFFMEADKFNPIHAIFLNLWIRRKFHTKPFYKNDMLPRNFSQEELKNLQLKLSS